jgi:light-regulated signal transduction histidine kinase (bacteriophytochrome)
MYSHTDGAKTKEPGAPALEQYQRRRRSPSYDELVELLRDRTSELERANESLERSNAEFKRFAYVVSHDLKEPLNTISAFAGLLEEDYKESLGETADMYIGFMVDGAERMRRLIGDLLDYSRMGPGQGNLEPVDLGEMIDSVIEDLGAVIRESGAAISRGAMPTLQVNPAQMRRVFQNLLANSVKFHGRDAPRVLLAARRQEDTWLFTVEDNGIGIAEKHLECVFDVFRRLHRRDAYEGTGIGLSICRRVVEGQGGRIWVESSPGAGSTFCFTLPARRDDGVSDNNRTAETFGCPEEPDRDE